MAGVLAKRDIRRRVRLLEALTPGDALSVMEEVLLRQATGVLEIDPAMLAAADALSLSRRPSTFGRGWTGRIICAFRQPYLRILPKRGG
jgi:hypothetical protein